MYCGGCCRYHGEGSVTPAPGTQVWQPVSVVPANNRPTANRVGQRRILYMIVFLTGKGGEPSPPSGANAPGTDGEDPGASAPDGPGAALRPFRVSELCRR